MGDRRIVAKGWSLAFSSVIGSSHVRTGMCCQDYGRAIVANDISGNEVLLIAVSDGAGSAQMSELGAKFVCESFLSWFEKLLLTGSSPENVEEEDFRTWLTSVRHELEAVAESSGHSLGDYACTFLGSVIGVSLSIFVQIGDGAAVASFTGHEPQYEVIAWPEASEYANSTYFVTSSNSLDHFFIEVRDENIDEVAIFTDGLQRIALNYLKREAHAPFFTAMFRSVQFAEGGLSENAAAQINEFLSSPQILERTDDDKTLVLASRRELPGV